MSPGGVTLVDHGAINKYKGAFAKVVETPSELSGRLAQQKFPGLSGRGRRELARSRLFSEAELFLEKSLSRIASLVWLAPNTLVSPGQRWGIMLDLAASSPVTVSSTGGSASVSALDFPALFPEDAFGTIV